MLHRAEICLTVNARCSITNRSFFSPDLICSLSMWNLRQQFTKSTCFAPADYGVSLWYGVSSTGLWGLGWGKCPFIIINLGLWSWVLSQNCIFLCFLMWIEHFTIELGGSILNYSQCMWSVSLEVCRISKTWLLAQETPEIHNYPSNSTNFPKLFFPSLLPYSLQLASSSVKIWQVPLVPKDAHHVLGKC